MILQKNTPVKKIFKIWVLVKIVVTVLFLLYALHNFYSPSLRDDESELLVIELSFYTITSLLLIYFFFNMYQTMKYLIFFDLIFLVFVAYHFHINYIILSFDLMTLFLIFLDNNDLQNFVKRKLRKIKG